MNLSTSIASIHRHAELAGSFVTGQGYDLSLHRTKELVHDEVKHRPPLELLAEGMLR